MRYKYFSHLRRQASILIAALLLVLAAGCGKDPNQLTDSELGLNPEQAQGRQVFRTHCGVCHNAYGSGGKGPSLKGLYRKQYLPSGLVANDQFVEQAIIRGRQMMPPVAITQQQLNDLMAYLHTL